MPKLDPFDVSAWMAAIFALGSLISTCLLLAIGIVLLVRAVL